jgi:hypothetical protein
LLKKLNSFSPICPQENESHAVIERVEDGDLSLQFGEMQGDVDEMQGGGHKQAKCRQISIVWMGLSLLREQGGFGS